MPITTNQMPDPMTDTPEEVQEKIDAARRKSIEDWLKTVAADKEHFSKTFEKMRENMQVARMGADATWIAGDNYTVPLIKRHVNRAVNSLYARTPRAYAERRKRLEYVLWDGSPETLMAAATAAQPPMDPMTGGAAIDPMTGLPMQGDPMASALLQEVQQVHQRNLMYEKMGKTLVYLFDYYIGECNPDFKKQMKRLIRRTKVCKVGYIEIGFQKDYERNPDVVARIADEQERLNRLQYLSDEIASADGDVDEGAIHEAEKIIAGLEAQADVLVREGLTFDFPRSTAIIPDKNVRALEGWVGANHVTHEYVMTADEIKENYSVDVVKYAKANPDGQTKKNVKNEGGDKTWGGDGKQATPDKEKATYNVWKVYDKKSGQVFTICEGYCEDYLKAPAPPVFVEGFFPILALTLNDDESETDPFPVSDVEDMKWPQQDYNSARQGAREHRLFNRPRFVTRRGVLEDQDKAALKSSRPFEVIEVSVVDPTMPIEKIIETFKGAAYDPALYQTNDIIQDVLFGSGTQQANMGGTTGDSATETSIAENSRQSDVTANIDDVDEFLGALAQAAGQVLMTEMDEATVKDLVGPGAVWPQFSRMDAVKEVYLRVRAGSSGRPNKGSELANLERAAPTIVQLDGVASKPLVRKYADLLDIDMEEFYVEGLASIVARNAAVGKQVQPSGGTPESDPNAQGPQGEQKQPGQGANERPPGGQPAYPAPAPQPGAMVA